MTIGWWSGVCAFIAGKGDTKAKAIIAANMWRERHGRMIDEDEMDDVDLWEQKHRGGLIRNTAPLTRHALPDFEIVESINDAELVPPFFAAEVYDLPRGSDIEWYATGISRGSIKISSYRDDGGQS